MQKKFLDYMLIELRRAFKTEDSRFVLSVGMKITAISLAINFMIYWFLFQIMRLNHSFFKALGFPRFQDETTFFNLIIRETLDNLPAIFVFHIVLFMVGTYVGWIILRPFKTLGDYAQEVVTNPNAVYRVEEFSTYTLLTRYSEFFFEHLRNSRINNQLTPISVPPQFSKIHKPVLDKVFMLHFGLLLLVISISTSVFIVQNTSTAYSSMVELGTKTLLDQRSVSKFLSSQIFIMDDVVEIGLILVGISYSMLGFHLYSKVSGAAFGIFSTMRSFSKGNYSNRVHLVGFSYVRDYTRQLNKYLDYMQNNFSKDPSKN